MAVTVRQLIAGKPHVYSVPPDATVLDALRMMARHDIGAVLVLDGGAIRGILSERDYARKVVLKGRLSRDTPVSGIMTARVVCVDPSWTTAECMALMTEKRVRHLPVVEGGRLVGVVSIGDLVRTTAEEQAATIKHLEAYITSGA